MQSTCCSCTRRLSSLATLQNTFYRRTLPSNLISFTSLQGKQLFKEALNHGTAEIFYSLSGNFTHQSEPAYCGLSSLAMVLNALSVDPMRQWRGVWRWYNEEMLECCAPLEVVQQRGITLYEFSCLAKCNGLNVTLKRSDRITRQEFYEDLAKVSTGSDLHMVVSFSRKSLGQTGDGHFSPIGAYHQPAKKVLVLDTARFKYPSYFVDVDALFDAMLPADNETGEPRGYFLLAKSPTDYVSSIPICTLIIPEHETSCQMSSCTSKWPSVSRLLCSTLPKRLSSVQSIKELIQITLDTVQPLQILFSDMHKDLAGSPVDTLKLGIERLQLKKELLQELESHAMYNLLSAKSKDAHAQTVLLLALPFLLIQRNVFDSALISKWESLRQIANYKENKSLLGNEVSRIQEQLETLLNTFCKCGRTFNQ